MNEIATNSTALESLCYDIVIAIIATFPEREDVEFWLANIFYCAMKSTLDEVFGEERGEDE